MSDDADYDKVLEGDRKEFRRKRKRAKWDSSSFEASCEKADAERDGAPEAERAAEELKPWWRDPATIPPRQFLYGRRLIRKNISASIGAGGRMKTSFALFEAVEMACARNLTTGEPLPGGPLRSLILNAEEDQDELDRRLAVVCLRYGVTEADLSGRLFVRSVRDRPLRLATLTKAGVAELNAAALGELEALIRHAKADVFMLDPWVSFHAVRESDNPDMDLVIKQGLGTIASRTNSAGDVCHHPGKSKPGQAENSVEDARGASAILWAVRSARVFNFMTPQEAERLGIAEDMRRLHVRISNGKANMGPIGKAEWVKIELENLPNGDEIACATRWKPPDPFVGVTAADMHECRRLAQGGAYRADSQSPEWFGYAVAKRLNIPLVYGANNAPKDVARVKQILQKWFRNKVVATQRREDLHRHKRLFVIPGPWEPEEELADFDPEKFVLQ
jgi:hypothetical protein